MPAAPIDGQIVRMLSSQTITSLTLSPNTGQSISGAPTTIGPASPFAMIYSPSRPGTSWSELRARSS